jgi:hypothetical protein
MKQEDKQLATRLCEALNRAKAVRGQQEGRWKEAIKQWNAELYGDHRQHDEPAVDIGTTKKFGRQLIARMANPFIQATSVYVARPIGRTEEALRFTNLFQRFLRWKETVYPFTVFVQQFLEQMMIFSKSVCKIVAQGDASPKIVSMVIPAQDFFHPIPTASIQEADWVSHRTWHSKEYIDTMVVRGEWKKVPVQPADQGPDLSFLPSWVESDTPSEEHESDVYEIHEFWTRDKVVTVDVTSEQVLKVMDNPYGVKPFVTRSYEGSLGSIDGRSLCDAMNSYHRIKGASMRMRLTNSSRALEKMVFYPASSGLNRFFRDHRLRSGAYEVADRDAVNSIKDISLSQNFSTLDGMSEEIDNNAQQEIGVTAYNFGVESVERPTARGQVMLIEEGKQPLFTTVDSFGQTLEEIFKIEMALYRYHYPQSITFYVIEDDAQGEFMERVFLQWSKEQMDSYVQVNTRVSSKRMSAEIKRAEISGMLDKVHEVFGKLLEFAQVATSPSPLAFLAKFLMDIEVKLLKNWWEQFDMPDEGQFDAISQAVDAGKSYFAIFEAQQQQIGQLQQMLATGMPQGGPPAPAQAGPPGPPV